MSDKSMHGMGEVIDLDFEARRARLVSGEEVPFSRVVRDFSPAMQEVVVTPVPDNGVVHRPYTSQIGIPNELMRDLPA